MVGSQLHAEPILVDERPRLSLISVPIQNAKRTIVILSLALAGCRGPVAPTNPTNEVISLRFLADSSTAPLLRDLTQAYQPAHLLITSDIQITDAKTVLNLLSLTGAPYTLLNYLPDRFDSKLWVTPAATNGVAIIVNPANPIANLNASQLRSILQGRVTNWQSLGGADLPLNVVALDANNSATSLIQSMVLGDRQIVRSARLATTDEALVEMVSSDPGLIGYVSMGFVNQKVHPVALDGVLPTVENVTAHRYPIYTSIVFAGMNEPGNDIYRAFFAWVQGPEGQSIVRRHYGGIGLP